MCMCMNMIVFPFPTHCFKELLVMCSSMTLWRKGSSPIGKDTCGRGNDRNKQLADNINGIPERHIHHSSPFRLMQNQSQHPLPSLGVLSTSTWGQRRARVKEVWPKTQTYMTVPSTESFYRENSGINSRN